MERTLRRMYPVFFASWCFVAVVTGYAEPIDWRDAYALTIHTPSEVVTAPYINLPDKKTQENRLLLAQSQSLQKPAPATSIYAFARDNVGAIALPESGTLLLLGAGLAGVATLLRRKKTAK